MLLRMGMIVMIKKFLPDVYKKDVFSINYNKLKENNIKCLLFDLDNTISPAKEKLLCEKTKELFDKLKKNFKIILFSNNFEKRVREFSLFYDVEFEYLSLKPLSHKYNKILKVNNYSPNEVAAIGDQIVTDIYGGNKAGMVTILVDPISVIDEKETFINRKIEKIIFKKFEKKGLFKKGHYYD